MSTLIDGGSDIVLGQYRGPDILQVHSQRTNRVARLRDAGKLTPADIHKYFSGSVLFSPDAKSFIKDFSPPVSDNYDPVKELQISDTKATARFIISTPTPDRYSDVVVPEGCEKHLASYKRNPQVFFSHRSGGFPIGKSLDENGNPGVDIVPGSHVKATCEFNLATQESEDVFNLVRAGALRTSSIGFIPLLATVEYVEDDPEAPRNERTFEPWVKYTFKEWELYEWSIVPVPANSECVRLCFEKGFGGRQLSDNVRQLLAPWVEAHKLSVPVVVRSGFEVPVVPPAPVPVSTSVEAPPMNPPAVLPVTLSAPVVPPTPLGLQILKFLFDSADSVVVQAKQLLRSMENQSLLPFLEERIADFEKAARDASALASLFYPDVKSLASLPSGQKEAETKGLDNNTGSVAPYAAPAVDPELPSAEQLEKLSLALAGLQTSMADDLAALHRASGRV